LKKASLTYDGRWFVPNRGRRTAGVILPRRTERGTVSDNAREETRKQLKLEKEQDGRSNW